MEYLSRLSGLVSTPAKAAAGITASPRLRKKPSLHPVGSVDVFHADWLAVQAELENPDERALFFGVARSDLPRRLQRIIDALVFESNRSNDGHTGPCMEYLLKYDILTELVHLSVDDRPRGIRGETIRALKDLIILLDEKFLSRQAANKPISQLIQLCLDEDAVRYQLDDDSFDASNAPPATQDDDYEEDLVDLMCHIASRIRNTPDLLQIFFTDEPVDDADSPQDARSLKDGSIIVSHSVFDDLTSDDHDDKNQGSNADSVDQRPPSPAGSVDSTATIQPSIAFASRKQMKRRLRFPLFSYLLKFVHREGRIGELARAGMLFLVSLEGGRPRNSSSGKASKSTKRVSFANEDIRRSLAVFIAHSDFADVLGAGLGAAYGLLPSCIRPVPRYDPTEIDDDTSASIKSSQTAITLASSSASQAANDASEALASATRSDDTELQAQLRLLIDLIEFCQDVLDSLWLASKHLTEAATAVEEKAAESSLSSPTSVPHLDPMVRKLAGAIAMAIRDTFIRNVVYPSLMESSDFDGSSAAVLNYLDVLVIVLRSEHLLTDVALDFLLPTSLEEGRERGYGYQINVPVDDSDRYSVKDLILDSLEDTKRPATRVAALRLARSLIVCHGFRACGGLLQLPPRKSILSAPTDDWLPRSPLLETEQDSSAYSKIETHFREIDALSSLLTSFGSTKSSESLQASLSNYLLDAEQALRQDSTFSATLELGGGQIPLIRSDPLVQQLFAGLVSFFSQPVEVNLAASGVLSALAASPARSLDGWLTHVRGNDTEREEPALVQLLRGLVEQVAAYRDCVPEFDRYLAERRRSLVLTDDLSAALDVIEPREEQDAESEEAKSLRACLTLPRLPSAGSGGSGRLQTNERIRTAERGFGIIQDKRASLPALSPPALSASLPPTHADPPASIGRSSALARLFGGARPTRTPSHLGKTAPSELATADTRPGAGERKVSASTINPYADHFRETAAVVVKTQRATGAEEWCPAPTANGCKEAGRATLSSVLDNTILLEELIKELLALIQVRRSWGVDGVSFL
ncbi:uncharacterized protein SPSC_05262 [Sporisorium scitamineum]|uniref:FHF complex subunit HOOK-interacting protein C-terminal domain-containing protein n=1 Tax=Sporisorium scitamineum TaxID=49012 RepID=A0A127Z460_9BASI|nr:uncharacterized protein SPSC_05262 [Sporisorium scitamineum]